MSKEHKPYQMIFNTSDCTDGVEYNTFEEAYYAACDCMNNWSAEEMHDWKLIDGIPHLTEEQIEAWDMMIDNCSAYVAKWNGKDYYDEKMNYVFPSDEDVEWLTWDEMKTKYGW